MKPYLMPAGVVINLDAFRYFDLFYRETLEPIVLPRKPSASGMLGPVPTRSIAVFRGYYNGVPSKPGDAYHDFFGEHIDAVRALIGVQPVKPLDEEQRAKERPQTGSRQDQG